MLLGDRFRRQGAIAHAHTPCTGPPPFDAPRLPQRATGVLNRPHRPLRYPERSLRAPVQLFASHVCKISRSYLNHKSAVRVTYRRRSSRLVLSVKIKHRIVASPGVTFGGRTSVAAYGPGTTSCAIRRARVKPSPPSQPLSLSRPALLLLFQRPQRRPPPPPPRLDLPALRCKTCSIWYGSQRSLTIAQGRHFSFFSSACFLLIPHHGALVSGCSLSSGTRARGDIEVLRATVQNEP